MSSEKKQYKIIDNQNKEVNKLIEIYEKLIEIKFVVLSDLKAVDYIENTTIITQIENDIINYFDKIIDLKNINKI